MESSLGDQHNIKRYMPKQEYGREDAHEYKEKVPRKNYYKLRRDRMFREDISQFTR